MRWALIGASDIAATQVLPALRQLGHEPVVVVGSDAERTARYATRNGVGYGTTSIEEALGAGRNPVDAVYVSTTNERHAAGVHAAVGAGCHVLCEKPLATSLDQARAMVDAAAGAGVVMATNHHLRNSPVIRALRGLVAEGALGQVVGVRVAHTTLLPERLRGWRLGGEAGAGVVLDLTVHDVDTVRFVTGMEVLEVAAIGVAQGMSGSDAVAVAGRLSGPDHADATLHLHDAFTTPHAPPRSRCSARRRPRWPPTRCRRRRTARSCYAAPTPRACSSTSGSGRTSTSGACGRSRRRWRGTATRPAPVRTACGRWRWRSPSTSRC